MSHLDWRTILEAMEKGVRPPHLDECEACEARWKQGEAMLLRLRPHGEPPRDLDTVARRILSNFLEPRPRWFVWPRWAWALLVPLCLAGGIFVWQHHKRNVDREYAAIMTGTINENLGGLDALLPPKLALDQGPWTDEWTIMSFDEEGE